jgi:hypothetical protein
MLPHPARPRSACRASWSSPGQIEKKFLWTDLVQAIAAVGCRARGGWVVKRALRDAAKKRKAHRCGGLSLPF